MSNKLNQNSAENSRFLLKVWNEDGYSEDFQSIYNHYCNYGPFFKEYYDTFLDPLNMMGFSMEKKRNLTNKIDRIRNFLERINFYIDNGRTTLDDLKYDFSEILYISYIDSANSLYVWLKDFELYHASKDFEHLESMNYINNFFLKISKYQNNKILLRLIQKWLDIEKSIVLDTRKNLINPPYHYL